MTQQIDVGGVGDAGVTDMSGSAAQDALAGDDFDAAIAAVMPKDPPAEEAAKGEAAADAADAKDGGDAAAEAKAEAKKPEPKVEDKGHAEQYELRKLRRQIDERRQAAEAKESAIAERERSAGEALERLKATEALLDNPEAYFLEVARRKGVSPVDVFKATVAKLAGQAPAIEAMEPVTREMLALKQQVEELRQQNAQAQQARQVEEARRSIESDLRADLSAATSEFPLLDAYDTGTVSEAALGVIREEYSRSGKVLTNAQALGRLQAKLEDDERRFLTARQKRSSSGSQARTETRQPAAKAPGQTLNHPTGPAVPSSIFEMSEDALDKHLLSLVPDR